MEVARDPQGRVGHPDGHALAIGAYDGIHRGHRELLRRARGRADELGVGAALVTFDRHPASVVRPESAPHLLTTLEQKIELLDATGDLDLLCLLTFDDDRRKETAEEFVREILVEKLGAKVVVVGADFHFGYQRQGTVAFLAEQGAIHGFTVDAVDLVPVVDGDQGVVYSSTLIRGVLLAGDVDTAARLLGRQHEVPGRVVDGDRRGGHELGFPTANVIFPAEMCLPAEGIYAGWLIDLTEDEAERTPRPAAISLGRRPTFYGEGAPVLLEAHVLDFEGDLYGHEVRVRFAHRLRGEEKFDSVEALVAQITRDVADTRRVLGASSPGS